MYMCTYVYVCVGHAWECQFVMLRNVTVYAQTEKCAPRMRMHQPSPARGKTCACAFLVIQKPNRPPLHRRTGAAAATAPVMVPTISTPLVVGACGQALSRHPDEAFACYLCIGLNYVFKFVLWWACICRPPRQTWGRTPQSSLIPGQGSLAQLHAWPLL